MPQELHVVQCFNCETFQVDIVKKIPKWVCKMCGEKQSVKKVHGEGTGRDCRLLVQSLNEQRLRKVEDASAPNVENISGSNLDFQETLVDNFKPKWSSCSESFNSSLAKPHCVINVDEKADKVCKKSKWNQFTENDLPQGHNFSADVEVDQPNSPFGKGKNPDSHKKGKFDKNEPCNIFESESNDLDSIFTL